MDIILIILGTVLLALGRRLFWLFVGAVGFVAGLNLATHFFSDQPTWVAHYAKWRSVAENMMAEPRSGVRYDILFPDESGW